jgi:hypothetical protein
MMKAHRPSDLGRRLGSSEQAFINLIIMQTLGRARTDSTDISQGQGLDFFLVISYSKLRLLRSLIEKVPIPEEFKFDRTAGEGGR